MSFEVFLKQFLSRSKTGTLTTQHFLFRCIKLLLNLLIIIEAVAQLLINGLIHPELILLIAAILEITILLNKVEILIYHIPYLLHANAVEPAIAENLGQPSTLWFWEEMKGIAWEWTLDTTRNAKAAMERMSKGDSENKAPSSTGDANTEASEKSEENSDNRIWRPVISRRSREQAKALYDKTAALFTDKFKS